MSRKNRAFALAVATAALVGVSAPVASAATSSGPTSGFNNDSLVNVSGNQLPIQACNNDIPINVGVLAGQLPLSDISAILGLASASSLTTSAAKTCTQTPSQTVTSSTNTGDTTATPAATPTDGSTPAAGPNDATPGFNNDSLANLSDNQIPVQLCNNNIPVNAGAGAVQLPVDGVSGALGLLDSTQITSSVTKDCSQAPTQDNSSTTTTGNTTTTAAPTNG